MAHNLLSYKDKNKPLQLAMPHVDVDETLSRILFATEATLMLSDNSYGTIKYHSKLSSVLVMLC